MFTKIIILISSIVALWLLINIADFVRRLLYKPNINKINYFKDKDGRIIIYHGINVCNYSKHSPDLLPWHQPQDYDKLNKWGFNLVRFVINWDGIEPERDKYDMAYLSKICDHIKYLGSIGVSVIVDIHQDLYSKKYSGNGFPLWACIDGGKPFKRQEPWNMNYLQPATIAAFRHFWKNDELQYKYINMVKLVASSVENFDNVVGIDIINEPFPALPWIRVFERKWLTEFYKKVSIALMLSSYKKIMFFEPWMCTSAGIPTYLNLKNLPIKAAYMPHSYPSLNEQQGKYTKLHSFWHKRAVSIKAKEAQIFGTPLLFGEWGISMDCQGWKTYTNDFLRLCETYGASWIWWSYDMEQHSGFGIVDNNKNDREYISKLSHVYPQKIAGSNPKFSHTEDTFYLEYDNTGVPGNTVVFVPDGFEYIVSTNIKYARNGNTYVFENTLDPVSKITITYHK